MNNQNSCKNQSISEPTENTDLKLISFLVNKQFLMNSENSSIQQDNEIQSFLKQIDTLEAEQLEQFAPEELRFVLLKLITILQRKVEQSQNSKMIQQQLIACRQKIEYLNVELGQQRQRSDVYRSEYQNIKILMSQREDQYLKYRQQNSFSKDRISQLQKITEEQEFMNRSRIQNLSTDLRSREDEAANFQNILAEKMKYVSQIQRQVQSLKQKNQALQKYIEDKEKEYFDFQLFSERLFAENQAMKERLDSLEIDKIQKVQKSFTQEILSSAPISQCENQHSQSERGKQEDFFYLKKIQQSNYHHSQVISEKKIQIQPSPIKLQKKLSNNIVSSQSYRRNTISFSKKANQSKKKVSVSGKRADDKSIKEARPKQSSESRKKIPFALNRRSGGNSPLTSQKVIPKKPYRVFKQPILPIEQKFAEDYSEFAEQKKYTEESDQKVIQILNKKIIELQKRIKILQNEDLNKRERITQLSGQLQQMTDMYEEKLTKMKFSFSTQVKKKAYLENIDLRTQLYDRQSQLQQALERLEYFEMKLKEYEQNAPKMQEQINEKVTKWIQKIANQDELQLAQLERRSPIKKFVTKKQQNIKLCSNVYIQFINSGQVQHFQVVSKQQQQQIDLLPNSLLPKNRENEEDSFFLNIKSGSEKKKQHLLDLFSDRQMFEVKTEQKQIQTDEQEIKPKHMKTFSFGSYDKILEQKLDQFEAISDQDNQEPSISLIRKTNEHLYQQYDLFDQKNEDQNQLSQNISRFDERQQKQSIKKGKNKIKILNTCITQRISIEKEEDFQRQIEKKS